MYRDFIPRSDKIFNEWQFGLVEMINNNAEIWLIIPDAVARLNSTHNKWNAIYTKVSIVNGHTAAETKEKNRIRDVYKKEIRAFNKSYLAYNPLVTNEDRDNMGLTVPSGTRTVTPVPPTAPEGMVLLTKKMTHIIRFRDSMSAGRGKPDKVLGCEIWAKIGGSPPVSVKELTYMGIDTRSPHEIVYDGEQYGLTVYYQLRWINVKGEAGPWSTVFSALIA